MPRQKISIYLLIASLLVSASLACVLTDTLDRLRQGKQVVETAQGVVTQIDAAGILKTGQAAITKAAQGGIPKTAQAMATNIAIQPGDVPPDIPIMPGEKHGFVGSDQVISYSIEAGYHQVLDFYMREMPLHGWQMVQLGTVIGEKSADLYYEKPGLKINVVINELPFVDRVSVVISYL